jgi:hypothetical protein
MLGQEGYILQFIGGRPTPHLCWLDTFYGRRAQNLPTLPKTNKSSMSHSSPTPPYQRPAVTAHDGHAREQHLGLPKDGVAVLNQKLHRDVLRVHVRHFALETGVSHDRRRENDGQVRGGHLHGVSRD